MKKGMVYIMAIFIGLMLVSGCNDEKNNSAKEDESMMEVLSFSDKRLPLQLCEGLQPSDKGR
ncbi:hypothetical protein [Virgibacillus sp. JSM 102003]|uniref:hypothetical protein n=1 Tax=Virgibacillus sp. JSM 102003 TaxID=1562108 RepID=UPI0035BF2295